MFKIQSHYFVSMYKHACVKQSFFFVEIVDMTKSLRCHDAIVLINSLVGSSIGNSATDTHMDLSDVKKVWGFDMRKEKYETLAAHYDKMEEEHYYSFVEPTLYSRGSRLGPVGKSALELWYFYFFTSFCFSI